ncbi:hypothetical protein GCM10009809_42100 [Isoptericola hypogeus]|uniref:Uncharacterized protein n=1 Tax=Isoptericola hypogeus TaxID=300179 RepID=A0ABN2JXR7_9MICO
MTDDSTEEVELGWIKVRKVLADTDSGVDIDVKTSRGLAVLDALGMLRLAEHWVMDPEIDGDDDDD